MTERDLTDQLRDGEFKVEPSADLRSTAKTLYGMYVALVDEGFSREQALTLVGDLLTAVINDETD